MEISFVYSLPREFLFNFNFFIFTLDPSITSLSPMMVLLFFGNVSGGIRSHWKRHSLLGWLP
jgi:hypothetical protein